jgi:hypothetical protein
MPRLKVSVTGSVKEPRRDTQCANPIPNWPMQPGFGRSCFRTRQRDLGKSRRFLGASLERSQAGVGDHFWITRVPSESIGAAIVGPEGGSPAPAEKMHADASIALNVDPSGSALGLLRYGFAIASPRNDAIPNDSRDGHLPCEK